MSDQRTIERKLFSRSQISFLAIYLSVVMILTFGLYAYAFADFFNAFYQAAADSMSDFGEAAFTDDGGTLTNDEIGVTTDRLVKATAGRSIKVPVRIKNNSKKSLIIDEIDISAIELEKKIIFLGSDPGYLDINMMPDPKESEIWLLTDLKVHPKERRIMDIKLKPLKKGAYVFTLSAWSAAPEEFYNYDYAVIVVE